MNTIAYALPEINAEVEKMKRMVENGVLMSIQKGELTPEISQQKWLEWAAAHRLAQRFNNQMKVEEK